MNSVLPVFALLVVTLGCSSERPDRPVTRELRGTGPGAGISEGVTGTVMDLDGEPVVDASVQVRSSIPNGPPIPEIAIVTDANGRYEWRLVPGTYELSVSADGFRSQSEPATVESGKLRRLDFRLAVSSSHSRPGTH